MALTVARMAMAEPSDADRATARALAEEGATALDARKYDVAADRFARADQLVHAPTLLLALAQAQVGLGKYVEAQESYLRIIREGVSASAPPAWKKALEAAQEEVKAIAPKLAWVTVNVSGAEAVRITVDGAPVPKAALGVKRAVNPGDHVVRAEADGYKPAEASLKVAAGETNALKLVLEPLPNAPAPAATRPATAATVTPAGADLGTGKSGQKTYGYVALGVGGAGLIVGTIAGVVAMGKHTALVDACPQGKCPPDQQSNMDSYSSVATVSTIGMIVGVVGVGTGAVLLLTAPPSGGRASIQPFVGLASAGAKVTFR
jgi:hypothetical protein